METFKPLSIYRHLPLLKRLPEARLSNNFDRAHANWVVFSRNLSIHQFEDIDAFTGYFNAVVDVWRVGPYEVALMQGELTSEHQTILKALKLDFASLNDLPDLSKPGLIVMDMDSTAIEIECIDEIAKLAGVGEEVARITEQAMQGELDFEQSLRQRVSKLKGTSEEVLCAVKRDLPLMADLPELINTLRQFGWKSAIASGGFTYFSDALKERLHLDYAQSNQLEIIDGKLTGHVIGDVVSAQTKADILETLSEQFDVERHNTIAVGDGANDLMMMDVAGLGIAFHAKPKVEKSAQNAIRFAGLGGVLCILSAALAKQQKLSFKPMP
ncbi:phosphoserine phosphatase [Vibrio ostreicida]|uniref:Phosphoserine phosphatase n=1 Tax=Vibrio ostreicida TaxID=526588 RepID=A0ABT8BQ12_9VIBR|nr:phosphoserine phosphatase [Vibrio ostreicida]MDN3609195.1 phosphoserine phosphatase [Vibrio ostreicida]NPD08087.1 phosphoserine phosphatase [Vibrio ostreicida]